MDICEKINMITEAFGTKKYKTIETKYGTVSLEITRDKYIFFFYDGIMFWDKQKEPTLKDIEKEISSHLKKADDEYKTPEKNNQEKPTQKDWKDFEEKLKTFDWYYIYSEDPKVRKSGDAKHNEITSIFNKLKLFNKEKAEKLYNKYKKS